jgi:hypothetical protein
MQQPDFYNMRVSWDMPMEAASKIATERSECINDYKYEIYPLTFPTTSNKMITISASVWLFPSKND